MGWRKCGFEVIISGSTPGHLRPWKAERETKASARGRKRRDDLLKSARRGSRTKIVKVGAKYSSTVLLSMITFSAAPASAPSSGIASLKRPGLTRNRKARAAPAAIKRDVSESLVPSTSAQKTYGEESLSSMWCCVIFRASQSQFGNARITSTIMAVLPTPWHCPPITIMRGPSRTVLARRLRLSRTALAAAFENSPITLFLFLISEYARPVPASVQTRRIAS